MMLASNCGVPTVYCLYNFFSHSVSLHCVAAGSFLKSLLTDLSCWSRSHKNEMFGRNWIEAGCVMRHGHCMQEMA